ncbi:acetyl-CoA carboxylase biotin carboxylase subunit family protein [Streptomyces sp. NPDC048644]|uniref:ATP-grasp domain-containing protein n=1 Tax=Streptomyces sp. NPDC048644 TaxID=3365582 RepID=UPI0037195A3E
MRSFAPRTRVLGSENGLRLLRATGEIRFPCVIKPAGGAGSAGVTVVTDPDHAADAWRAAARSSRGMYGLPREERVLVQDYAEGTEYSVESITQHGTTTHLCATRKTVTPDAHRVEVGHSLPAALPPGAERAVHHEVERVIAAVGIRNGASHTEVIVTGEGRCSVIEIGARLGAGYIGVLLARAGNRPVDGPPEHRPRPRRPPHPGPPRVRERSVPDQPAHRPPYRGDRPAQGGPRGAPPSICARPSGRP